MRLLLFPILLLAWPLAEIAGFVIVGRSIGLWGTLGLVIGTSVLGGLLLRAQGIDLLRRLSAASQQGEVPGQALVEGGMIVVAAILLLLPGFITDILGLLLFVPFVRNALWSLIGRRVVVVNGRTGRREQARPHPTQPRRNNDIDGPVIDLDEEDYHRNSSSPWSRGPRRDG